MNDSMNHLDVHFATVAQRPEPDPHWAPVFEQLHEVLQHSNMEGVPAPELDELATTHLLFFETYFTNYIEGSCFPVNDAERFILQDGWADVGLHRRPDAKDLLNTWRLIRDPEHNRWSYGEFPPYAWKLHDWHGQLMQHRESNLPGMYKPVPNMAGNTIFANPEHVEATLRLGFELAQDVPAGLPRAIMLHHITAGTHPFIDGNGRISRLSMNAYLSDVGQSRIVVTTRSHKEYIMGLARHSSDRDPRRSIEFMQQAQQWTASVDWSTWNTAMADLERAKAFADPWD